MLSSGRVSRKTGSCVIFPRAEGREIRVVVGAGVAVLVDAVAKSVASTEPGTN